MLSARKIPPKTVVFCPFGCWFKIGLFIPPFHFFSLAQLSRILTDMKTNKTQKSWFKKALKWLAISGFCGAGAAIGMGLVVFSVVYYQLPPIDALTQYRPKVPLRIYTADGDLIGEFG